MKNLYAVLGVSPQADPADLKTAYRKRVSETHPDRPGGNRAKFEEIQAAYETLADPAQRAAYVRARREWLEEVGAIDCPACGQANRIPEGDNRHPVCGVPSCRADLEIPQGVGPALRDRAVEVLQEFGSRVQEHVSDLGEHVQDHIADLVVDSIDLGFEKIDQGFERLRQKIGVRRREHALRRVRR